MPVVENAASAPAAPAPKTAADYQNAVTKQLNEKNALDKAPPVAPAAAPADVKPEAKPPADVKPEDAPSPTIKASLEKLAERSKALREREERIKPFETLSRIVDPMKLERAVVARDPLAVLESLGMRYEDVVDRVLSQQPKTKGGVKVVEESPTDDIVQQLKATQEKLEKLEREREEERIRNAHQSVVERATKLLDAQKFPFASKFGQEAVEEAITMLMDYQKQTGGNLPAESFEENIQLALAHVEEKHRKTAERYGVLTSGTATRSVKTEDEAPVTPRGEANGQTTLSSSLAAPAMGGTAPKTDADYQAMAIAQLRKLQQG